MPLMIVITMPLSLTLMRVKPLSRRTKLHVTPADLQRVEDVVAREASDDAGGRLCPR